MKKLVVAKKDQCMACLQCQVACASAYYKRDDTTVAYLKIGAKKDGEPKPVACPQCGKCAEACEAGAITQNKKGVYTVDKKKCTGCGKCVEACPYGLSVKAEDKEVAGKCIACGICVKACPMEVLEIREED